jgi:hypothetical protein
VDLYDVKTRGLHSPLNSREISVLFRVGVLDEPAPCKPVGEAKWRTIDELFPLLKYESGRRYQMEEPKRRARPARVAGMIVILIVLGTVYSRSHQGPSKPPRRSITASDEVPDRLRVATRLAPMPDSKATARGEGESIAAR